MTLRASVPVLLVCALLSPLACTHGEAKADTPAAASTTAAAPAAGAQTASPALTASSGPAVDEVSPCATDADCGFTRVGEGGCCPMLCSPRVVTQKRAAELEKNVAVCNQGKECPLPLCRPPLQESTPSCQQKKCVAKTRALDPRMD